MTAQHSSHASPSSAHFEAERWSLRVTEEGRFWEQKPQPQQLPNLNARVCFSASQMSHMRHTLKMIDGLSEAGKPERQALSPSMHKSSTGLVCFWQGRKGKFLHLTVLLLFLVGQFLLSRYPKYRSVILNSLCCAKEQYFWYKNNDVHCLRAADIHTMSQDTLALSLSVQ